MFNWYTKFAKIVSDPNKYYTSVGHSDFPTCVWVWNFPDDFQKECWEKHPLGEDYNEDEEEYYDVGHDISDIWNGSDPYSGRFDPTKKEVSVICLDKLRFKEIPEALLNRLYKEFGVDIIIHDFTG